MFSQFKLKMGKSHSSSGTKSNKKADKSNANVSSNATNGEITSQSQTLNQRNHPMSILKHSEGSRSNASSTSSGFPAASSSSASGSGQPHPNVHYADQPNTSVSHPALMYSQDSQYSNGLSTNTRLSTSSTSSNLNRNGTLSRPLPSNYLSSSLSSSAISNGVSINGSISLTTSQNSTMGRPQVPPSMVNIGLPQPIYMSRTQPIYGATGAPNMARPMLIHPHHPQAQMMSTVQPIYGQTTATPGPVNPTAINAIYGKTGSVYGTYKAYPNSGIQSMPIGRPFTMHASMQPIDGRWSRAASAMPPDEEDIGIMSEAETSSTGFRRSSKIRASLPIVRTMSKTLDRSLGLVFLQYRNVTKRSLLPNEITSMDTVKALYVRSFPRELTMAYFDDRDRVRIYIHDQSKDVFNDLVDLRAIKDRCILRIYEYDERSSAWLPAGGAVAAMPMMNSIYGQTTLNESSYAEEYFSEPEFLMESRTSTVQRKRFSTATVPSASGYYGTVVHRPAYDYKPNATQSMNQPFASNGLANTVVHNGAIKFPAQNGYSATLPRGSTLMNMNTYGSKAQPTPPPKPQRSFTSSLSSSQLNQPLHSTPSGPIAPKLLASNSTNGSIGNNRALPERPYSVAGHYPFDAQHHQLQLQQTIPIRPLFDLRQFQMQPNDRIPIDVRTQHARAVAAAATAAATVAAATSNRRAPSTDGHTTVPLDSETQRLLQQINKYVESLANSVQKSNVSASQSHGSVLIGNGKVNNVEKLLELRRSSKEIANDVKALREWFVTNQQNLNDLLKDAQTKLNQQFNLLTLPDGGEQRLRWNRMRLSREETVYRTHVRQLEQQLCELEASVEELRAKVITHRCKVDMADVEAKALVLNQSSKHLSDLKASFPALQSQLKITMTKEMQVVVDEEKFLKEEPDRLENALKRCKKLTGTLVTLKRLATVQGQRLSASKGSLDKGLSTDSNDDLDNGKPTNMLIQVTPATPTLINNSKPENVMDSLLDELQEFALCGKSDLRSSEKQATSSSRPVRRSLDLGKKTAPQPPPRSSSSKINDQQDHLRQLMLLQNNLSNAKLHSADRPPPTLPKPNVTRSNSEPCAQNNETNVTIGNNLNNHSVGEKSTSNNVDKSPTECNGNNLKVQMALSISNTSLSSIDSQESVMDGSGNVSQRKSRKERLEERHQELLRKQRLLQEKYTQLQQLVRGELPQNLIDDLKKTSSESNLNGQKTQCKSSTNGDSIDTNECTKNIGNGHLTSQN